MSPPTLTEINPETWNIFKQQFENYATITDLNKRDKGYQVALFLHSAGTQALKVYNSLKFAPAEDRNDLETITRKFDEHIIGQVNETYERYKFNRRDQGSEEPIENYVAVLRELVKKCNYGELTDSLIKDRIILGIRDNNTRKKLLQIRGSTLNQTIDICRSAELTSQQLKSIDANNDTVSKIIPKKSRDSSHKQRGKTKYNSKRSNEKPHYPSTSKDTEVMPCLFCNTSHIMNRKHCPAWGKRCTKCNRKNHFAVKCKSISKIRGFGDRSSDEYTEDSTEDTEDTDDMCTLRELSNDADILNKVSNSKAAKERKDVYAMLLINDEPVKCLLDTGATTNVLPARYVNAKELYDKPTTLITWNNSYVNTMGKCKVKVRNPANKKKYLIEFKVVKQQLCPILGKTTCERMNLIQINYESFHIAKVKASDVPEEKFKEVFDNSSIGTLPGDAVHIKCKLSTMPKVMPARREPIALRARIKKELSRLCDLGVLAPVSEPTSWVNQMVVQEKKDGSLRICLDPRQLNNAIEVDRCTLPTLEEVLPQLNGATTFTKLDLRNGYWHVKLNEESSILTTFDTGHGKFRWLRLPFGLNISSFVFQQRLNLILGDLNGVVCVADDIIVYGKDVKEHDANLSRLLCKCAEVGVKLNKEKSEIRMKGIDFLGHRITSDGLQIHKSKVDGIMNMPKPTSKDEVRSLLGTVNYLTRFLPNLAHVIEPIGQLIQDRVKFIWGKEQEKAWKEVLKLITTAPVLAYYNPEEELILQCDASSRALGAVLLQRGRPIAYKSRTLTDTETRYAPIEKEMLAVAWGLEKFHQYTYGRKVHVHSDHKPLEAITKKPMSKAPRRLQSLLLRTQNYDCEIKWVRGKDQHIADMLSRACNNAELSQSDKEEYVNMCKYLPMSDKKLETIRNETENDTSLHKLKKTLAEGWPSREETPAEIMQYYSFADELCLQDGIIFKGDRVIIPKTMRNTMLKEIHTAHGGQQACLQRARESIYWPAMTSEIKEYVSKCEICRKYENANQRETLMTHEVPEWPWQKIGVDEMELNGKHYLITVDYFSNFWEIDRLRRRTTNEIISKLKAHFARYGIPCTLVSDNAAQFTSEAFQNFMTKCDVEHTTSSPHYAQSNGMAESAVKTAKRIMTKTNEDGEDVMNAVLHYRNTPSAELKESPAQRFLGRRTRTSVPITSKLLRPKGKDMDIEKHKLKNKQDKQSKQYNAKAKDLKPLDEGDVVRMKPHKLGDKKWRKGVVLQRLDERSYEIEAEDGGVYRRNRVHLKNSNELPHMPQHDMPIQNEGDEPKHSSQNENNTTLKKTPEDHATTPMKIPATPIARPSNDNTTNRKMRSDQRYGAINEQKYNTMERPRRQRKPPKYLDEYQIPQTFK